MAKEREPRVHEPVSFFPTGDAIDYLVKNTFTESAGSRVGFPKVAIIITDGKSQDEVDIPARELRSIGVEVFSLGRLSLTSHFLSRSPSLHLMLKKIKVESSRKDAVKSAYCIL